MSRIGKKPIVIPAGVKVALVGQTVKVEGPKGRLEREVHTQVAVSIEADQIQVAPKSAELSSPIRPFETLTSKIFPLSIMSPPHKILFKLIR